MSACAESIACCCSAWICCGVCCAASPSSPRASRTSWNGPSGISLVTRVSMPESAIRWSVAATSASRLVFSGGIGSGAAEAVGGALTEGDRGAHGGPLSGRRADLHVAAGAFGELSDLFQAEVVGR